MLKYAILIIIIITIIMHNADNVYLMEFTRCMDVIMLFVCIIERATGAI